MAYMSPLQDTKFVLENLLPPHVDLDDSTIEAVLSEAVSWLIIIWPH